MALCLKFCLRLRNIRHLLCFQIHLKCKIRAIPQPDIIEHFGNADAVPQPPKRCLSRKAGIVRYCLRTPSAENQHLARLFEIFFVNTLDRAWFIRYYYKCVS